MVRLDCPAALNSYLLKIRFKRWGKLWSPGSVRLQSSQQAERRERRDYRIGTALYQLPVPSGIRTAVTGKDTATRKELRAGPQKVNISQPHSSLNVTTLSPSTFAFLLP
jgi:hypothetical protein